MGIDLGTSTASTLTGYVSGFIDDFSVVITLIIGVILAMTILKWLIGILIPESEKKSTFDD